MAKEDLRAGLEAQGVNFKALEPVLSEVARQVIMAGATQVPSHHLWGWGFVATVY